MPYAILVAYGRHPIYTMINIIFMESWLREDGSGFVQGDREISGERFLASCVTEFLESFPRGIILMAPGQKSPELRCCPCHHSSISHFLQDMALSGHFHDKLRRKRPAAPGWNGCFCRKDISMILYPREQ